MLLPVGVVPAIASLALHDKSWLGFLLAVAAPVAAVVALPPGWCRGSAFGLGWAAGADGWPLPRARRATTSSRSTARGYTLLGLGLVLLMLVVATLPVGRRAPGPR